MQRRGRHTANPHTLTTWGCARMTPHDAAKSDRKHKLRSGKSTGTERPVGAGGWGGAVSTSGHIKQGVVAAGHSVKTWGPLNDTGYQVRSRVRELCLSKAVTKTRIARKP